ncbi:hypothetical protein HYV71_00180 [Candidatus Uhrbacteria bacterium]|nr:hypothetical protein [Candidatus Uhrbacteria bacterium]
MRSPIYNLVASLSKRKKISDTDNLLSIDEAVGALAFYYEKIRNVIEYQDEHLLRQTAIRRIIERRRLVHREPNELSEWLLKELIRSRYLPNNSIPQSEIGQVASIISFYFDVEEDLKKNGQASRRDHDIIIALASCAIDEHLMPLTSEDALVSLMYETVEQLAENSGTRISSDIRKNQLGIAVYRVLLRPDVMRLRYHLFRQSAAYWADGSLDAEQAAGEYQRLLPAIDFAIKHPLNRRFLVMLRRYRLPFVALHAVLKKDRTLAEHPEKLESAIRSFCASLYATHRRRLRSRAIHAFIYILLTKMVLGLALEIPYDLYILGEFKRIPFFINALFPPILLAFLALTVRFPKEKNTERIVKGVREIANPETPREIFVFKSQAIRKKNNFLSFIFHLLYGILFSVSFGLLVWLLASLDFSLVSGVIFFVFFSLIMFFGMSLRRSVQELSIVPIKVNFIIRFLDQFFVPVLHVGHWLSFNIPRINIFVFLFDIFIEIPFQTLIDITEEWFAFLKEKKEEIE